MNISQNSINTLNNQNVFELTKELAYFLVIFMTKLITSSRLWVCQFFLQNGLELQSCLKTREFWDWRATCSNKETFLRKITETTGRTRRTARAKHLSATKNKRSGIKKGGVNNLNTQETLWRSLPLEGEFVTTCPRERNLHSFNYTIQASFCMPAQSIMQRKNRRNPAMNAAMNSTITHV